MNGDPARQDPITVANRTWPDVVAELVQALGKAAPAAIVVGGLLFAFYAFYGLVTGTKQEQLDAAQAEVQTARANLLETFDTLNSFTTGQLASLRTLMELREEAERRAREAEKEVEKVQEFIAEKDKIQGQLQQLYVQYETAQKELYNIKQQQEKTESQYQAKLQQRAKRIETLSMELYTGTATEQISAGSLLSDFAREPDEASADSLENLVGISAQEFVDAIHDDLGYAFWLTASDEDDNANIYLGTVAQSEYKQLFLITMLETPADTNA